MTKTEFKDLLHRFASSTPTEAEAVLQLEKKYPYSQVLRSLAARVSKDHTLDKHTTELQLAAVYSADRNVLKEIMGKQFLIPASTTNTATIGASTISEVDTVDYAEEVIHDLERLHQLKHTFEMMFIDVPPRSAKSSKVEVIQIPTKASTTKKKQKQAVTKSFVKPKAISSAKKTNTVANKLKTKKTKTNSTSLKNKKVKPKGLSGDELISQIELTKKKLRPSNARQLEQIQLIDKFIKKQPAIANNKNRKIAATPQVDLAGLSQGQFGENVVSETLVKILISQGKKEKAIELLKKLIWKFPQKKANFAAQIESLKK
jgi:hypothetical protein